MSDLEDCVLLISVSDQLSEQWFLEELFKSKGQTLQTVDQPTTDEASGSLRSHAFLLDNKYYNADIRFVTLNDPKQPLSTRLADSVEVLGILFDLEQVGFRQAVSSL